MDQKIFEYEKKIEFLEGKVIDLEKHNAGLREILIKNVQFSTKLSNITYEIDCLLVKKTQEIRDLEKKLAQSLARVDSKIEDFDIDMTTEKDDEIEDLNSQPVDVYDYVEVFAWKRLELEKDSNGYYNCPECSHRTRNSTNLEDHYRGHTNEKPFGCKLCP